MQQDLHQHMHQTGLIHPSFHGDVETLKPAAILIPLVKRNEQVRILLTRRSIHLAHHPGQVSFPGGRIEPTDINPQCAALRETFEEIGHAQNQIELIGEFWPYHSRTGFHITPFVGWLNPPYDFKPQPQEVESIFEVPADLLLNSENFTLQSWEKDGKQHQFYSLYYETHHIWGVTADILFQLSHALKLIK
ncbi:MAG: CoA pyrophosphatase [Alphaproteobacteria bacterium]